MVDRKEGIGIGVIILLLGGVWLLASGKVHLGGLLGSTMTPTAAATTQTGKQPLTEPQEAPRELISEVPPPDVQTHYLGAGVEYAKFSAPIDVGGAFKQWGVTTQGIPVVSKYPPETYPVWEWMT